MFDSCFISNLLLLLISLFILGGLSGFTCILCGKWFTAKSTLIRHRIWHHREAFNYKFKCHLCPYGSYNSANLKRHSVVHSLDRAFKCEVCNNRFSTRASLNQHLIIHFGESKDSIKLYDFEHHLKS